MLGLVSLTLMIRECRPVLYVQYKQNVYIYDVCSWTLQIYVHIAVISNSRIVLFENASKLLLYMWLWLTFVQFANLRVAK